MILEIKKNIYKPSEQFKYWNDSRVSKWVEFDINLNLKFSKITKILFKSVNIKRSDNVLDVGCGSGFTTKICSDKVGSTGKVIAIDISLPLLNLLKRKYKQSKNIIIKNKDLETFKLENNKFNVVISRFGMMFFENPDVAFSNIYDSLKKNGVLCFVCWTDFNYNQFFSLPMKAVSAVTGIQKPRLRRKPGPFSFNNINYLRRLLKNSKFKQIDIKAINTILPAQEIALDVDMLSNVGIAASIIREKKINKKKVKKIRELISDLFYEKIHSKNKNFKAKFFLITAKK
mgnify:CR=1 FL=1